MVRAYNDNTTEAELLRAEAVRTRRVCGTVFCGDGAVERALERAEQFIRAYDLDNKTPVINDWQFPLYEDLMTPEEFWTLCAEQMRRADVTRVCVISPLGQHAELSLKD